MDQTRIDETPIVPEPEESTPDSPNLELKPPIAPTPPPAPPKSPPQIIQSIKAKPLIFLAVLLTLALFLGSTYFLFQSYTKQSSPLSSGTPGSTYAFQASVKYLIGNAWKIVGDRKVEIKEGDILAEADEITTDSGSRLVLTLDDGSTLRLDENSTVQLAILSPETMIITDKQGTVFSRVQKDPDHIFIVQAGEYSVTSLGTAFSVENNDEVSVTVYESEVKIEQEGQLKTQVSANQIWQETKDSIEEVKADDIQKDEFLAWSLEQEDLVETKNVKDDPTATIKEQKVTTETTQEKSETQTPKTPPKSEPISSSGSIKLEGAAYAIGVILEWSTSNLDAPHGFKVVKSKDSHPVYPGDHYTHLSDSSARRHDWKIADGNTWHFRVCQYLENGQCGVYSNDIAIQTYTGGSEDKSDKSDKTQNESSGEVHSISLSADKHGNSEAKLHWDIDGHSPKGFKIVWSKNSGPTYPSRDGDQYHYYNDSGKRDDIVTGLNSGHTYYFRVCEYLGSSCGVYSNETAISY